MPVEVADQLAGRPPLLLAREPEREGDLAPVERRIAGRRIDGDGDDLLRRLGRHLLDVHAARLAGDEGDARGGAVDERREVELARRCRSSSVDVDAVDDAPGRARLLGDERIARASARRWRAPRPSILAKRTPPLSPAAFSLNLPLPRPPAWICALTTQTGPASSCAASPASRAENAALPLGVGTPNCFRELFGLVLVDVHGTASLDRCCRKTGGLFASVICVRLRRRAAARSWCRRRRGPSPPPPT